MAWHFMTVPVGRCRSWTAELVLLTVCLRRRGVSWSVFDCKGREKKKKGGRGNRGGEGMQNGSQLNEGG